MKNIIEENLILNTFIIQHIIFMTQYMCFATFYLKNHFNNKNKNKK